MTDKAITLVEASRTACSDYDDCDECPAYKWCHDKSEPTLCEAAADLIESLAAELEQVKQERDGLSIMLTAAQSAAETYKREMDAVEYYGNIDVSANAVFDGMTRADGPRFRETDEMCPLCQRDLEVYYCENRTYAVRCRHCKTVALVSAVNADEAASKIGLHVKPVRHGRWTEPYRNDIWDCYQCSCCKSAYDRKWRFCPNCGATMDLEG